MAKLLQGAANDSFTAQPPNIYSIPSFFEGREDPGALSAGSRSMEQAGLGLQRGAILTENEMAQNETRNAQVAASALELQHTQQLQATLANNGNLGDLQQKQENDWADFGQNYETGQAQQAVSLLRNQALDRTTQRFNQAYSIQFGQNVKAQGAALASNLSQSVAAGNLALPDAEGQIDAYTNTFPHVAANLRAAVSQQLKSQIEGTAASVAIRSNPADAQKIVGGFTHLTPEQRTQLLGLAQSQVRAQGIQQELALSIKQRNQQMENDATLKSIIPGIVSGKFNIADITSQPGLTAAGMENAIGFAHRLSVDGPAATRSNAATYMIYLHRLSLPAGTTGALDASSLHAAAQSDLADGSLSMPDYLRLADMADKLQSSDPATKQVGLMTRLAYKYYGDRDPMNAASDAYAFSLAAESAVHREESAGRNPMDTIFNSKNPAYLLSAGGLAQFNSLAAPGHAPGVAQPTNAPQYPTVSDAAAYNSLPAGAEYYGPDGKLYRKGAK